MKKISIVIGLVTLLAVCLSSCKSHERCPAYGKIDESHSNEHSV